MRLNDKITNKIIEFVKKNKQSVKKIVFKIFVLLTPLVATLVVFPLPFFQRINLKPTDNQIIRVSDRDLEKPDIRSFVADIIQVPLNLKWYDIYIVNKSKLDDVDGCVAYEKPVLRIIFKEGNPDKYSQSDLNKIFENDTNYDNREIPYDGRAKFRYAGNDGFLIKIAFFYGCKGNNDMPNLMHALKPEYELYAQPSFAAWFIKLIFIYIFWILFLPSSLEFVKLLKK